MEIVIFFKYSDVFQLFKENGSKTLCMVEVAAIYCLYSHKTFKALCNTGYKMFDVMVKLAFNS